jgi:hypothetical protein
MIDSMNRGLMPPARLRRSRGARTALLCGSVAFLVLELALAVLIETSCPILRDPDHVQKASRLHQRLADSEQPATVVMLGSSRTVFALDGTPVERELRKELGRPIIVFNFGLWGAGPATHLLSLERLLAEGAKPNLVLIEVLPPFLSREAGLARDLGRLTADHLSRQELAVLEECGYPMAERRREWWLGWPVPFYSHRFAVLNATLPFFVPPWLRAEWSNNPDASCFVPQMTWSENTVPRAVRLRRAYEEYFHSLQNFHLSGPCPIALRRLLETCRRGRIAAALVLLPEGSEFRNWYPAATLKQVRAFLADLQRDFRIPVIDAREWIEDDAFSDAHHLLPAGATQFSLRLGREFLLRFFQHPGETGHAP